MNNVPLWQYKREDDSALRSVFSSPLLVIFSENLFSIIRSLIVKRTRLTELRGFPDYNTLGNGGSSSSSTRVKFHKSR